MCFVCQVRLTYLAILCHYSMCCVFRSSSGTKTDGVTVEDNPAYGVSLDLPYEVPAVTKTPPDPPPESVYEPVRLLFCSIFL